VNGVATTYTLDPTGLTQVLAETTGSQTRRYLPGLAQYEAGAWAYQLPDGLGSVRQMVNSSRQLTLMQSYDPFGNPTQMVGTSPFGYTGEQVDPTGLVYLRARYYSPPVGRFLTPDSLVPDPLSSMGWNRYAYVGNNPVRYTDPSGHCLGFALGVDTLTCIAIGETLVAGGALAIAAYTIPRQIKDTQAILESFPSLPAPNFGPQPGTTLLGEDINSCYPPGSSAGPTAWQLPPFSEVGPVGPGFNGNSIALPNFFPARSRANDLPNQGDRTYVPPKQKGNTSTVYDQQQGGYVDVNGNVWVWDRSGHGGPHWDVQHKNGSHTNVSPEGRVIGRDNF
jgi:RHS repeat-associated protein